MPEKQRKPKKCSICKVSYVPANTLQKVCSTKCAIDYANSETRKRWRKERSQYRERTKPKKSLLKEAQQAFNAYIRTRDYGLPCISCNQLPAQKYGGTMDCGHWHGTGAHPELRFTTWNATNQCTKCNRQLSGNTKHYERGLIARHGRQWLTRREQQARDKQPNHYSKDQLKRIKQLFSKKSRLYRKHFRNAP